METLCRLTDDIVSRGDIQEMYNLWVWVKTGNDSYKIDKEFIKTWNSLGIHDWIEYEKLYYETFKNKLYNHLQD